MNIVIQTFQSNLLKSLCEDEDETKNKCLISNTDLETNYIKLLCNHKFNYEPIFKEINSFSNLKALLFIFSPKHLWCWVPV